MAQALKTSPSKVLFVASNPTQIKFDFVEEFHRIEEAGRNHPGSLDVVARWSVSLKQLTDHLRQMQPDVIHVLSPGVHPATNALVLSDERGQPQYVDVKAFSRAFGPRRTHTPKLVVLNTCHSRPHAEALVPYVGCAIAMDGTIYDDAAVGFADAFYWALATGDSVASAFAKGRAKVEEIHFEQKDIPVLLQGCADPSRLKISPLKAVKGSPATSSALASKRGVSTKPNCLQIFCSYSHKDSKYRAELETFLANLRMQGILNVWHDRLIKPGTDWAQEIDHNLDYANMILLLISSDFLASQYCMGVELKRALERHKAEGIRVIPILVRECDLEGVPFSGLQWLPTGSKPIKKWSDRDSAWTDVAKGIREAAQDVVTSSVSRLTR